MEVCTAGAWPVTTTSPTVLGAGLPAGAVAGAGRGEAQYPPPAPQEGQRGPPRGGRLLLPPALAARELRPGREPRAGRPPVRGRGGAAGRPLRRPSGADAEGHRPPEEAH